MSEKVYKERLSQMENKREKLNQIEKKRQNLLKKKEDDLKAKAKNLKKSTDLRFKRAEERLNKNRSRQKKHENAILNRLNRSADLNRQRIESEAKLQRKLYNFEMKKHFDDGDFEGYLQRLIALDQKLENPATQGKIEKLVNKMANKFGIPKSMIENILLSYNTGEL